MRKANCKPFWRASKGAWYCWIDGSQRSLGKKKRAAESAYRELLADPARLTKDKPYSVREVFNLYLDHLNDFKPETLRFRKRVLDGFCKEAKVGRLRWDGLQPEHLETWLKSKEWASSTKRSVVNTVCAAFHLCQKRKRGGVTGNPVSTVPKPAWKRRQSTLAPDDEKKVYDASSGAFRDILTVLRSCGARPNEICSARIGQYKDGKITLEEHKEEDSGEDRIIYLTAESRVIVERLIGTRTEGPIFRNTRGGAWSPDTLYCRFKRLRKKLGLGEGVFPYNLRARFATTALNKGMDSVIVARLLGHSNAHMLEKHYYTGEDEFLRAAAEEAAKKE
jgi:integrase